MTEHSVNLMSDYTLAENHQENRRLSLREYKEANNNNVDRLNENFFGQVGREANASTNKKEPGGMSKRDSLQFESLNDSLLSEVNKYCNLGLSMNSQELIGDFYQILLNIDSNRAKSFEEILYSIIEDIQAYKKDVIRLEQSLKNEKEHNEELLKQMIEEADHQLAEAVEKIRNEEKENYEKLMSKLKEQFNTETSILHENLSKMKIWQEKHIEEKTVESQQTAEILEELKLIKEENKNLRGQLRESTSEISILRSNLAELNNEKNDKTEEKQQNIQFLQSLKEISDLKDEIKALHDANKKLIDTNDVLRKEFEAIKLKNIKPIEYSLKSAEDSDDQSFANMSAVSTSSCSLASNEMLLKSNRALELTGQTLRRSSGTLPVNSTTTTSRNDSDEDVDVNNLDSGFCPSANSNLLVVSTRPSLNGEQNLSHLSEISLLNDANELKDYMENKPTPVNALNGGKKKMLNGRVHQVAKLNRMSTLYNKKKDRVELINDAVSSTKTPERMFKVVFAGDAAVGKTSFIMRYCKNKFLTTLSSTLGVDFHMKMLDIDGKSIALQLWDTCGQERFRSIARSYFRKADGVVLMYDCTYERSFLNIREWMLIINENGLNSNSTGTGDSTIDKRIPIILVGNKTDLRDACRQANKRVIEHEDGLKLAKEYGALFVETSAKMGTNMDDSLMAELSKSMICKQELESDLDYLESKLNGANCQFEATSTRQVDKLSEKVKSLSDENRELKTLFQECQIKSDLLERQLKEIMSKKRRESSDAESNQENINKASDSKATNSEPKALHNAYKKLNDINDLLRDEIENIKMKASRIAEREPLRHLSSSEKQ